MLFQNDVAASYYQQTFPNITRGAGNVMVACPFHADNQPSLSIDLDCGLFCCFGCGRKGDMVAFHRERFGVGFGEALNALKSASWSSNPAPVVATEKKRRLAQPAKLSAIWSEGSEVTPKNSAGKYLFSRGFTSGDIPTVLRHHPHLPYYGDEGQVVGRYAALIAAVQSPAGNVIALQRKWLTNDGAKLHLPQIDGFKPIKMTPPSAPGGLKGASVRLGCHTDELALGEGIETTLAYSYLFQIPGWACLSAWGLANAWVPKSVRLVHICVDNDEAGRRAATTLEARLLAEGRKVIAKPLPIVLQTKKGADWNDVLMENKDGCQNYKSKS